MTRPADQPRSSGSPRIKRGADLRAYLLVVAGVVLATGLRLPLDGLLPGSAGYGFFYLAILGAAWFLGPGPAVFATLLSLAAVDLLVLPPRLAFGIESSGDAVALAVFAAVAAAMVLVARAARATRRRAADSMAALALESGERDRAAAVRGRLAAIVESSNDAIISKNLNGIIESWNAGAERILGYRADEMIGQSIMRLIPPDRQDEEKAILASLRRGERVEHFDTIRMAKGGRPVELSITVSPVRDASGTVIGASKVARDITERRRIERALAEQREWFRVTLGSIGDGVITTDREARITYMNEAAETLTGWSSREAESRPIAEVFVVEGEEDGSRAADLSERVLRTGEAVALDNSVSLIARDGSKRHLSDRAAPIVGDDQQVLGVVLVFRDVSEHRRLELERETAAREREILLESERVARGEAERASRLKDEFVATLSHELRTPLTAILGWAQILRRKSEDKAAVKRGLEIIERNTVLQSQLISDLLDMSRIVSGRLRLDLRACDIVTVIDAAIETVRPAADAKSVRIERRVEGAVAPLPGDAARLQQVIWNLLSNAIKFTEEGGQVRVLVARSGPDVEIAVEDTGIGIRAEFLPLLFDRFRQADASTSRRFGGLGLGLAIVKELVELHLGSVTASSPGEGQGSRFLVRLPTEPAAGALAMPAITPPGGTLVASGLPAGLRVLVVEDDPDTRDFLRQILREAQANVTAVASSAEGLEAVRGDRPDLIVSDISMPGEDGYAFIRRVRALEGQSERPTPAVALTAFARHEDRMRALDAGFQAHVSKPIDHAQLMSAMSSAIQQAPSSGLIPPGSDVPALRPAALPPAPATGPRRPGE